MLQSLLFLQKKFLKKQTQKHKTPMVGRKTDCSLPGSSESTAEVLGGCSTETTSLCPAGVSYNTACAHSSARTVLMPVKAAFLKGIITAERQTE